MNKFGIQHQHGAPPDTHRLDYSRMATVKLLGNALNLGFARDIRQRAPNALLVLRAAGGDQDYTKPADVYADYACGLLDPFLAAGLCDVAEPLNEPIIRNDVDAMRLNEWQMGYNAIMHGRGYSVGAYNFSVGNPAFELWRYLTVGLREADWLMLHEYGAPRLDSDAGYTSLRHRAVYAGLPADCRKAMLITECGIDLWTNTYAVGGGGYRRITTMADYIAQIKGWLAELDKDSYVKGVHLYGYGMESPWTEMGFDVAGDDGDREQFFAFVNGLPPLTAKPNNDIGGAEPPVTPPPGGTVRTAQNRINAAWRAAGIDYYPAAAFPKKAAELGLGRPVTGEYRDESSRPTVAGQGFDLAFLECADGDWANMTAYDWLTGEPWQPSPAPSPVPVNGGIVPYRFPPVLTSIGALGSEGVPLVGKPFYRLTGATVRQGVSAFLIVTVFGKSAPAVGVKVVNHFPDGNGEVIQTDGSGVARFQFAASSAFSVPGEGPFTVFIADDGAYKDFDSVPKQVNWSFYLSDIVKSLGDFHGEHTEIYLQFVEQPH